MYVCIYIKGTGTIYLFGERHVCLPGNPCSKKIYMGANGLTLSLILAQK